MWMMMVGYGGDYGSNFNESAGSFNGRRLRPLMPRPTGSISSSKKTFSPMPNPNSSYCTRIHKANLTTLNASLGTIKDQTKLDTSTAAVPLVTTRWCPTPEQLHALKEMYRHGMRRPTTEQIHQIAAKLRRFGKIEGKNVFYWFQNHKARARQRHRRMLIGTPCEEQRLCNTQTLGRKKSGLSTTGHEITLKKNKATSSSGSTLSEDSVSIPRTAASEKGTDGWIQLHMDRELQLTMKRSTETVQPNWQLMNPYSTPPIHSVHTITSAENTPEALGSNIFDGQRRDIQTLQLFPIHSHDRSAHYMDTEVQPMAAMDTSFGPNQSSEFLVMKEAC